MFETAKSDAEIINELENQVYNLLLYLDYVKQHKPRLWARMMKHFDGMGGFPEVIVKHE